MQYIVGQLIRFSKKASALVRPYVWNLKGFEGPNYFAVPVQHSFVLSLTTSPTRLRSIGNVLKTFTWSQIDKVVLTLPQYFRNDPKQTQDPVILEDLQKRQPQLQIVRVDNDSGPDLKLLGALTVTKDSDFVVVIDDDMMYSNELIDDQEDDLSEIEKQQKLRGWTFRERPFLLSPSPERIQGIAIQPGYCSFCIPRACVPNDFAERLSRQRRLEPCKRHDDFTMGSVLQDLGFVRQKTRSPMPLQLDQGLTPDALHVESLSFIKHKTCSDAIWSERKQCPAVQQSVVQAQRP